MLRTVRAGVLAEPNFRRFYEASHVFTGQADVTEQEYLEPWIQWYSLHTGFSYDQHGVYHLTDAHRSDRADLELD